MLRGRTLWLTAALVVAIGAGLAYLAVPSGGTSTHGTIGHHVRLHRPPGRPLRILFVGDSLTVGDYASQRNHAFPALVTAALRRRGSVDASVRAKVGVKASYWATRALPAADLIVLELGTNDFSRNLTPPATFDRDYRHLVANARAASPHAALLCLSIWRSPRHAYRYHGETLATYNHVVAADCRDGAYVPVSSLFDRRGDRSPGRTILPGTPDGFHPNDRGHRAIAAAILDSLRY